MFEVSKAESKVFEEVFRELCKDILQFHETKVKPDNLDIGEGICYNFRLRLIHSSSLSVNSCHTYGMIWLDRLFSREGLRLPLPFNSNYQHYVTECHHNRIFENHDRIAFIRKYANI